MNKNGVSLVMVDELGLKLNSTERFLCSVLTHCDYLDCKTISDLYSIVGDKDLFSACKHNKIESIAAHSLSLCLDDVDLPEHWVESYTKANNLISSYMAELDHVAALFARHQIPLVALKNSGITRGLYSHYGACPMGDMDVLINKAQYSIAEALLIDNGYVFGDRNTMERAFYKELPSGEPLWFELLVRSVDGRWIRPDQEPSTNEIMARSVEIEKTSVRILSPEDNLLQVALHTAKHSFVRAPGFRLHTDVDRIVRSTEIDWQIFVGRVKKLQVKTAVFFSLALAHDLLSTPIPQKVLNDIRPNQWKVRSMTYWLQKVGLFDPDGKKWGRVGYVLFVSLLYDDFGGLLRGVFPSREHMLEHYGTNNMLVLPLLYFHRLFNLLWKRVLGK